MKGSAKLVLKLPSAAVAAGEPAPAPSQQPAPLRTPLVPDEAEAPALFEQGEVPALDGSATPLSRPSFPAEAGLELSGSRRRIRRAVHFAAASGAAQSPERSSPPAPSAGVYSAVGAAASHRTGRRRRRAAAPPAPAPAPPPPAPRAAAAPPRAPPPRAPAKAPEYHGDLPSLPATDQLDASGRGEFPALRPSGRKAAGKATGKGRPAARRRGLLRPAVAAGVASRGRACTGRSTGRRGLVDAVSRGPDTIAGFPGAAGWPGAGTRCRRVRARRGDGRCDGPRAGRRLPGQRVLMRGQASRASSPCSSPACPRRASRAPRAAYMPSSPMSGCPRASRRPSRCRAAARRCAASSC